MISSCLKTFCERPRGGRSAFYYGDGKSERREGLAKRASKLSGSHWQSATRFYTNIVVKRSSSTERKNERERERERDRGIREENEL